uniref:Uncharacterized protein n=1 Tax=Rhodnius prolixus TaxID=13249 RepID=T1HMV5_RHOPR
MDRVGAWRTDEVNLGVDSRKSEAQVRGTVVLPKGIGKDIKVAKRKWGKNKLRDKSATSRWVWFRIHGKAGLYRGKGGVKTIGLEKPKVCVVGKEYQNTSYLKEKAFLWALSTIVLHTIFSQCQIFDLPEIKFRYLKEKKGMVGINGLFSTEYGGQDSLKREDTVLRQIKQLHNHGYQFDLEAFNRQ